MQSEGFIVDAMNGDGLAAVFEDDGDTGYLYLYAPNDSKVLRHLHVYNRGASITPLT